MDRLWFVSLLLASMITAMCVRILFRYDRFCGDHMPTCGEKLLGQDHRYITIASVLSGSLLLLLADTCSRSMGNGSALPVGAIASLLGAPFFVAIIFSKRREMDA